MTRTPLLFIAAASFVATSAIHAGGWAVITVEHLPDSIVAGEPVTLGYVVRQHGERPLGGLSGRVTARGGGRAIVADAVAGKQAGHYTAALTFPNAGEWSITIDSGFAGRGTLALVPLKVAGRTEPAALLSAEQRGRHLFVAKGCATCHRVDGRELPGGLLQGPALVPQKYQGEYLAQVLANPALIPRSPAYGFRMPNLSLQKPEIAALVSFINARPSSATTTAHK
jgi:mono/diheme cytochrome c family protein